MLQESQVIFCNGQNWNASLANCINTNSHPSLVCTFDRGNLCGWTPQDQRKSAWSLYQNNLRFDSSNLTTGVKHLIFSPTYASRYLDGCLSIMFKMNGANMGDFAIYVVSENGEDLQDPIVAFHGNKGNHWNLWTVSLNGQHYVKEHKPFQLVFQTVRGRSYLSDIYIGYVEILADNARCQRLIQTSKVLEIKNDVLSPESCNNRCHKNISRPYWSEGFCTCHGIATDCLDYGDFCNESRKLPQFLKQFGISSWNQIVIGIVTLIALVISLLAVILLRKRVSFVPRMISEQDIYGRLAGINRYVASEFNDDMEDFIDFELAEESQPAHNNDVVDIIMDHQYAAIEEFSHHRYEEPPFE